MTFFLSMKNRLLFISRRMQMETREKNTKERILEEALKLFSQSGYMGTSMNDIAAELGVTKAALYKHYKSKQPR